MNSYPGLAPNSDTLELIRHNLSGISIKPATHRLSEIVTMIFREQFMIHSPEDINLTTWTYHTALSLLTAARTMGLGCSFEAGERLDAIVDDGEDEPCPILLAEWESQGHDIFGPNKELVKLCQGVLARPGADALLLTYWPGTQFFDFMSRAISFWQQAQKGSEARLYLLVVGYEKQKGMEEFRYLRTFQISSKEVIVWDDVLFD